MRFIRALLGDVLSVKALAALLGARLLVRVTLSLIPLALVVLWPRASFETYAAAMTQFVFVVPLLSGGIEKSALKLISRRTHEGDRLLGVYLGLLSALTGMVGLWIALAAARSSTASLVALAGAFAVALGVTQVLIAMHRALGRIWLDVAAQGAVFAGLCAGVVAAWWLDASVLRTVGIWVTALTALDIALAGALVAGARGRLRPEPGSVRMVTHDVALQGATDVVTGVSITLLYAALTVTGRQSLLPALYVVLSLSTMLSAGYTYVMRVVQPAVAVHLLGRRLDGSAQSSPIWRMRNVGLLAVYATLLLVVGRSWTNVVDGATWPLAVLFVAYAPVLAAVASVHFVFENGDPYALRMTVRGATLGLAAVALMVVPLVTWAGVVGALAAIVAGDLVHLAVLVRSLTSEARARPPVLSPVA